MDNAESVLLGELNSSYKEHGSLIGLLDDKFACQEAKAGLLTVAYVIIQCILYIQATLMIADPLANQQQHYMRLRWVSLCLSGLVSVAFWVAFVGALRECFRIKLQQNVTFLEREKLYRRMRSIQTKSEHIAAVDDGLVKALASDRYRRYAYVTALNSALLSVAFLVSYSLLSVS